MPVQFVLGSVLIYIHIYYVMQNIHLDANFSREIQIKYCSCSLVGNSYKLVNSLSKSICLPPSLLYSLGPAGLSGRQETNWFLRIRILLLVKELQKASSWQENAIWLKQRNQSRWRICMTRSFCSSNHLWWRNHVPPTRSIERQTRLGIRKTRRACLTWILTSPTRCNKALRYKNRSLHLWWLRH